MLGGYAGRLLRVDLDRGTLADEALPGEATLRKFVGGVGLGSKILYEEVPTDRQPLDPRNPLLFMTGPMAGTTAAGSNNCVVMSLSYDAPYLMSAAYMHAYFGAYLKFAGYDGIIVQGAAKTPAYLVVYDGRAELRDATQLWGKDTFETTDALRKQFAGQEVSVAAIGPAGENRVHGSLVLADKHHAAAKGGGGAVMGSKMLKAVVVGGNRGVSVRKPQDYLLLTQQARDKMFRREGIQKDFVEAGRDPSNIGVNRQRFERNVLSYNSMTAARNLTDPDYALVCWQHWEEQGKTYPTVSKGCFGCSRSCGWRAEITDGPFAGQVVLLTQGGENFDAQWLAGLTDAGSVLHMAELYNRLGLDSGLASAAISLAIECYEKGLITQKDTGGLELTWGNIQAVEAALRQLVRREGFGAVLADGPTKAAERIGGDAPNFAIAIKGASICMHDWRGDWSSLLAQILSNMGGPGWQGYRLGFRIEPDLGYDTRIDPFSPKGKAEGVRLTSLRKLWEDCLGICWHNSNRDTPGTLALMPRALAALTGWEDFTLEEALIVGERVSNLQRLFNCRRGLRPQDDLDVSARLLEAPPTGKAKGQSIAPYLRDMVLEYYGLMGWDKETGEPLPATLQRLGLGKL